MATKSILKEVRYRDKILCRNFASALESAKGKSSKKVVFSKTRKDVPKEKIADFFKEVR